MSRIHYVCQVSEEQCLSPMNMVRVCGLGCCVCSCAGVRARGYATGESTKSAEGGRKLVYIPYPTLLDTYSSPCPPFHVTQHMMHDGAPHTAQRQGS